MFLAFDFAKVGWGEEWFEFAAVGLVWLDQTATR